MPNQNYCAPRDEIKMAQCDLSLSYPTCKTEERLCKISYNSWCPSCDKESPRKRSKSDTIDFSKRKSRELRKFEWDEHCEECENMDFECDGKDLRYETCRIRSNLCELPTTYITNNCQAIKVSSCPSDFQSVKSLKGNDHEIRSSDFDDIDQNFGSMVDKNNRISKLLPRIEESSRNINGIANKMVSKFENNKTHFNSGDPPATPSHLKPPLHGVTRTIEDYRVLVNSIESRKSPLHFENLTSSFKGRKGAPNPLDSRKSPNKSDDSYRPATTSLDYRKSPVHMDSLNKTNLHGRPVSNPVLEYRKSPVQMDNSDKNIERTKPGSNLIIDNKKSSVPTENLVKNTERSKTNSGNLEYKKPAVVRINNIIKNSERSRPGSSSLDYRKSPAYNVTKVKPTSVMSSNYLTNKNIADLKSRITEAYQPQNTTNNLANQNKVFQTPITQPFLNRLSPTEKTLSSKGLNQYDNDSMIEYETNTFFNRKTEVGNLKERYMKEVEVLKERLKNMRNTHYTNHFDADTAKVRLLKPPEPTGSMPKEKIVQMDFNKLSNLQQERTLDVFPKTATKPYVPDPKILEPIKDIKLKNPLKSTSNTKISLKTKSKFTNVNKLKKLRTKKINHSKVALASDTSDSECSGSEDSNKNDNVQEESSESGDSASTAASVKELVVSKLGSDPSYPWPLRQSLFPHVPPYLSFLLHDNENSKSIPHVSKYLKWKLSTITPIIIRKTLVNSGFRLVRKSNDWVGTWGKHMKSPVFKTLKDDQKLNHFPGTFQLGRKDRLWRNFQRMISRFGHKEFGFLPQTYVLPQDLKLLKQHWINKSSDGGDETYILKPPASARGTGIRVINKWCQLPKRMSLVVQEYISNPLLINGSKFDLRLYVLVTSFHPLRVYLYPEGLARFASVPYDTHPDNLRDRYMHLTNYSINKLSSAYTANEDANACKGHKWTLTKLLEYLAKRGTDTRMLWKNIQQLVIKTILSAESSIVALCEENLNSRYNCYELFGIDVLLDSELKCWLLEVNISPSLHSQSPLDEYVKGPLVKTLFELAQFHVPPRIGSTVKSKPACFDPRIYTKFLTKKEINKHNFFCQVEYREQYLNGILANLTGDDVRHLLQAEDEACAMGKFEKIFPTPRTYKYLDFIEPRYYNRLFDAWECKYEKRREDGLKILRTLCQQKIHLKVAPPPPITQSSPNLNQNGELNLQKPKEEVQQIQPSIPTVPTNIILGEPIQGRAEIRDINLAAPKLKTDIQTLYNAINMHAEKRNSILRPLSYSNYASHV